MLGIDEWYEAIPRNADEYSDLEIPIFWVRYPDEKAQKHIVKELNAEYFYPFNYEAGKAGEDNIKQSFRGAFTCPLREAFENTKSMLLETLGLVNGVYPEIDTTNVLSKLKSARRVHEQPVNM